MLMKIDMIKGAHLKREVHLSTVSGVASTKPELVNYFDKKIDAIDIITTKSFQINNNPGNREPVICEVEVGSFGNSVGLRNLGMEASYKPLKALYDKGLGAILNISLSASSVEDFITLVRKFDDIADILELNFSCPHAASGYGASIGCDLNIASLYVREIVKAVPERKSRLLVKLTPNVPDIGSIAKACIESGADGIVAINTVGPNIYYEKHTNIPILNNKLGGKGGASGLWIREKAISCIREIRNAIGDDPILIGMGGVTTGRDVASFILAGSDAVGIGSAFARVSQDKWDSWLTTVKKEAEFVLKGDCITDESERFLKTYNQMEYEKHTVLKLNHFSDDILIIELDGTLSCSAGQFAFLYLPGVGEKPFSVAHNSPLTFLIKKRGLFTNALFDLKVGDDLFVRGLYGAPLESRKFRNAVLLAGGSGVAVLPSLCRLLAQHGTRMEILVGTVKDEKDENGYGILEKDLSFFGSYKAVADNGVPGRVIHHLDELLKKPSTALYVVGPEKFMAIAARKALDYIPSDAIYLSMEKNTMCGVGLCGECLCGDRLTCQYGTFMDLEYILREAPELL